MGDERYVRESSKHSNINMCKKHLLGKIKILDSQIYQITTSQKSIKKDARSYENKIKRYFFKKKIAFDLILLGVGHDGHIASLFRNNIKKNLKKMLIM